jgi:hypothetical protein
MRHYAILECRVFFASDVVHSIGIEHDFTRKNILQAREVDRRSQNSLENDHLLFMNPNQDTELIIKSVLERFCILVILN